MEKSINHSANLALIRDQLLNGRRISVKSVWKSIGTTELRHYIAILRKTLNIASEWVTDGGVRYKVYYISKEQAA